jgi:hypothetical protein
LPLVVGDFDGILTSALNELPGPIPLELLEELETCVKGIGALSLMFRAKPKLNFWRNFRNLAKLISPPI